MSGEISSRSAIKGVGYLSIVNIILNIVGLARIAVLARLLTPVDFGIFALAMVLIKGLEMITAVGTQTYIIQKENINDDFVGNAWTANILRGLIICFVAVSLSSFYSRSIGEPRATAVLYIIALTPFFDGLTNPCKFLATRKMMFGKVGLYELFQGLLQTIIVIILAYLFRDVRSLAWGMAGSKFLSVLVSFPFFGKPPMLRFHRNIFKELLSVGKHFIVIQVGAFIMSQADNLIVGIVGGTAVVGIYVIAYRISEIPVALLHKVIGRVAMPVYSRIQTDKERLSRTILSLSQFQLAIIVPIAIFIFILARPIVLTIYGDKWIDAIPVVQALMLVLLSRGISDIIAPFLIGTGSFKFASQVKIIEVIVFLLGVYAGAVYHGAVGAALGAGAGYCLSAIIRIWFICKKTGISYGQFMNQISKPLLCCLPGIAGSLVLLGKWEIRPVFELSFLTGLSISIYLFASIIFQKKLVEDIKVNLMKLRS